MGHPRMWDKISAEYLQERYWRQGWSIKQIAAELDVSWSLVQRTMLRYGIERRPFERQPEHPEAASLWRLYWLEGLSMREVADRLGVSGSSVYRALDYYGIPRRSWGGNKAQSQPRLPEGRLYVYRFQGRIVALRLGYNGSPPCSRLYTDVVEIPVVDKESPPPKGRVRVTPLVADWLEDLVDD